MTKNERYAALNSRFDERSKTLRELGFKYEGIKGYPIAVFTVTIGGMKSHVIQASAVMHADDYFWTEIMVDAISYVKTWK